MKSRGLKFLEETNLNIIDNRILMFCFEEELSTSELQNKVGIAYKNFLPHLKKLEKYGLIIIKDNGRGRKKQIRTNINSLAVFYYLFGLSCLWISEEELVKDKRLKKEITRFLKENSTNTL